MTMSDEKDAAKFILGFDLGTTNSVLAYAPLDAENPEVELLALPQLVSSGTVESRTMLPSFTYLANTAEAGGGARFAVGQAARLCCGRVCPAAGGRSARSHGRRGQVVAGL